MIILRIAGKTGKGNLESCLDMTFAIMGETGKVDMEAWLEIILRIAGRKVR